MRVDRSFQTDARAKPARPEVGTASGASGLTPSVLRDRDELVEGGVELLLARMRQPLAKHGYELRARAPVDEDDEPKAEPLLVLPVELGELGEDARVVAVLLGRALADARMRRERLHFLVLAQPARDLARAAERIVLACGDEILAAEELDADARRRHPTRGVEDVSRDHPANLLACVRCSRAISSSSARTSRPSRTISSPPT